MRLQVVGNDYKNGESTDTLQVGCLQLNGRAEHDKKRAGKKHVTQDEMELMCKSVRDKSRYAGRDELMILMAFNHGLRVSELLSLQWQNFNMKSYQVSIQRVKGSISGVHPISNKRERMLLNRLYKSGGKPRTGHVFINERNNVVGSTTFQRLVNKHSMQVMGLQMNAHSLRHGCGTYMIDSGHDVRVVQSYLGHSNIQNTCIYLHESTRQFDAVVF